MLSTTNEVTANSGDFVIRYVHREIVCRVTGKPHVTPQGSQNGNKLTLIAEPSPQQLVRKLAYLVSESYWKRQLSMRHHKPLLTSSNCIENGEWQVAAKFNWSEH